MILTLAGFITATVDYETTYEYHFGHVETRFLDTTSSIWSILTTSLTVLTLVSIVF